MKIKKFTGTDTKEAMRLVREFWGPDAVILANKRLADGVEITAAIDLEEALEQQVASGGPVHPLPRTEPAGQRQSGAAASRASAPDTPTPTADAGTLSAMRRELSALRGLLEGELSQLAWREGAKQHPLRTRLTRQLAGLGLDREFASRLAAGIAVDDTSSTSWKKALLKIAQMLEEPKQNILDTGGTIAVVGSTGVGKTTSVAKLAALYALRHGRDRVGLLTTDCFRIGGQEQLDTFGKLLGIPVLLATNRSDLAAALDQFADKQLVLIDTAGMSQRDMGLSQQFSTLKGAGHDIQVYLALSATAQKGITDEVVRVFSDIDPDGTIITKVDEAVSLGAMLTTLIRHQLPTMFISNGQQIPEDLHVSKPIELVKIARDLMDQIGWQQPPPPALTSGRNTQLHA